MQIAILVPAVKKSFYANAPSQAHLQGTQGITQKIELRLV